VVTQLLASTAVCGWYVEEKYLMGVGYEEYNSSATGIA